MQVRVLFFGVLKDLLSSSGATVTLPEGATVGQLTEQLRNGIGTHGSGSAEHPVWGALAVAVNREYANRSVVLHEGDEVALLPPVSGGTEDANAHRNLVVLTRERIDRDALVENLKQPSDGAVVVFDGIVRDNTRGRKTLYLDYEAYEEMALAQMQKLAREAAEKYPIDRVGYCASAGQAGDRREQHRDCGHVGASRGGASMRAAG